MKFFLEKQLDYFFNLLGFLFLNFTGLAIGALWTDPGVISDWYSTIDKAPWTPPGLVFGLSWTTIMICFSVYMTNLFTNKNGRYNWLILLSWTLNILWNPLFFHFNFQWISSIVIILLTLVLGLLTHVSRVDGVRSWWLLLPYFIWLNIATSLNLYVAIMN
jgi:benzodiazapine receptor